ncbi:MAG: hypothetical protein C3F06_07815 [Candidatus Methanoperedenaceae archaeon]|nr:MAG: hypothetical protein C3F06_07815 [Candidatus Methanoperedenaceae archaeon]
MDLKFGLKLWSINTDLIDEAIALIDEKIFYYIELFVIPETDVFPFLFDVPYIIHIPHHKFKVNIGDSSLKEYNLHKIDESIEWADKLNAKFLILHSGHGSMKDAKDILYEIDDKRILIENMPKVGLDNEDMIGYSPGQIEELLDIRDFGMCLDFGHAVKAALSLGVDYKEFVQEFMKLEPRVFHISDGKLNYEKDEHLGIGFGEYDIDFFMRSVKRRHHNMVTVETPRATQKSLAEDVENVEKIYDMTKQSFKGD